MVSNQSPSCVASHTLVHSFATSSLAAGRGGVNRAALQPVSLPLELQVLWETLTGQQPWEGMHPMQVRRRQRCTCSSSLLQPLVIAGLPAEAGWEEARWLPTGLLPPILSSCPRFPAQVVGAVGFQGRQLPPPPQNDPFLADLCRRCLVHDPRHRPFFPQIVKARPLPLPRRCSAPFWCLQLLHVPHFGADMQQWLGRHVCSALTSPASSGLPAGAGGPLQRLTQQQPGQSARPQ